MKSLYEIKNAKGIHLCYQVAKTEAEAVEAARVYYGHKGAKTACFIRVNCKAAKDGVQYALSSVAA